MNAVTTLRLKSICDYANQTDGFDWRNEAISGNYRFDVQIMQV